MNTQNIDTPAPSRPFGIIHKPSKRLLEWGLPIDISELNRFQKMHDALRNLDFLNNCMQMASWFLGRTDAPATADGTVGHALYHYNLPCGAQLAIWIPKLCESDGKIAVYMTGCVGKQDIAAAQCSYVLLEIRRAMGG